MCVVSAINDWGRQQFPDWQKLPTDWSPQIIPTSTIPNILITPSTPSPFTDEEVKLMKRFLALLQQAKELDEAAGLSNCEDPEKAKFEEAVERRLKAVEDYIERVKRAADPSAAV
jgi:hypothetical protein